MGVPTEKIRNRLADIEYALRYLETSANTYVLTEEQFEYMEALGNRIHAVVRQVRASRGGHD